MIRHVRIPLAFCLLMLGACASAPPQNSSNICSIFEERSGWYKAARKSEERWGVPMEVNMAFLYQESGFRGRAKPPRKKWFGFIPGPRPSDAYGYAQALDNTWNDYQVAAGNWGARRSSFKDAVDFVGWYNDMSNSINGIRKDDAYNLYLAYHEGNGGYRNRSYAGKDWLLKTATAVQDNASRYSGQLEGCESRLNRGWFSRLFF
jgi:hypothetical protein